MTFAYIPWFIIVCGIGWAGAGGLAVAAGDRLSGARSTMDICVTCHGLNYITYQDLIELGVPGEQVDTWRGDAPLHESVQPLTPLDASEQAYGVKPPELSLMADARGSGSEYIYNYLTGYYQKDDGSIGNRVYPATRMPDILGLSMTSDQETHAKMKETAAHIAAFLGWAADPLETRRHRLGYAVLSYLVVLTVMLYLLKRRIWKHTRIMSRSVTRHQEVLYE
jgi:hypothetical protein